MNLKIEQSFKKKWNTIKYRCENKNSSNYKYYGKKGIRIEWKNFNEFKQDMYEEYVRHTEKHGLANTTIDRIDNNKNYCKINCRWATWKIQHENTTIVKNLTHNGKTLNINQWSKKLGIHPQTLYSRLDKLKMPINIALSSNKFKPAIKWQNQKI
jgi:hypothetical protein